MSGLGGEMIELAIGRFKSGADEIYRSGVPLAGLDRVKSTLKSRKILLVHLGHRKISRKAIFLFFSLPSLLPPLLLLLYYLFYFIFLFFSLLSRLFLLLLLLSLLFIGIVIVILFSFSSFFYRFPISSSNCSSIVYLLFCCCDRYNHCSLFHLLISPFLDCFFLLLVLLIYFPFSLILLPSTLSRSVFFFFFFFLFLLLLAFVPSRTTLFHERHHSGIHQKFLVLLLCAEYFLSYETE
jgi:hypothetical protein